MLTIDSFDVVKSETSSKGNQHKFYKDGYWIKLDSNKNSEGLAEEFASVFASCIQGFNYVKYKSIQVEYNSNIYNACISHNMLKGYSFVSLRHLLKTNKIPLNIFIKDENILVNINNVVKAIKSITGLDLTYYLGTICYFDSLILNEDRHYMNLGVLYNGSEYKIAPCFDNGSSLLCTNWTYRGNLTLNQNIARVEARPFSKFFQKQVQAFLSLGVPYLRITDLTPIYKYDNILYRQEEIHKIKYILQNRLNFYLK